MRLKFIVMKSEFGKDCLAVEVAKDVVEPVKTTVKSVHKIVSIDDDEMIEIELPEKFNLKEEKE